MKTRKGHSSAFLMGIVLILYIVTLNACAGNKAIREKPVYRVGIVQLAQFSELNETRRGILESLEKSDLASRSRIDVEWASAGQQRLAIAPILDQYQRSGMDLIITISSPCLEEATRFTFGTPVVFGATIDPGIIGLRIDREKYSRNFTGVYGDPPLLELGRMVRQILPDVHTIGVLWNPSEINSRYEMLALRKMAEKHDFDIVEVRVRKSREIEEKTIELIIQNPDIILLISDNTVARSLGDILPIINHSGIPLFSDLTGLVEDVAVIMIGLDHYLWGQATGKLAIQVLKGTPAREIPIQRFGDTTVIVNVKRAKSHGIEIPASILAEADRLIE